MPWEEAMATVKRQVCEEMGIYKWQLRLVHDGVPLQDGMLVKDLVKAEETSLELLAFVVEGAEVLERSKKLHWNLRLRRFPFRHYHGVGLLDSHKDDILNGDVAFHFHGDSLLELLLRNCPQAEIAEPMSWMLAGGASVNQRSSDGSTPLLSACCRGLGKEGLVLLQHGAKPRDKLPDEDDALVSALKFFEACETVNARAREEDLDLGLLCCALRASNIGRAKDKKLLSQLEEARLTLSQAAIEVALVASPRIELSKSKILEKSGMDVGLAEALGEELWAGWPTAFFTFSDKIPQDPEDWDGFFSVARSRILSYHFGKDPQVPNHTISRRGRRVFHDSDDESAVYVCTCPYCSSNGNPLETDSFVTCYEEYKSQNQKWKTSKANAPRRRRAPYSSTERVSRSSRMARRLPTSYKGFHVNGARQKRQTKGPFWNKSDFDSYAAYPLC